MEVCEWKHRSKAILPEILDNYFLFNNARIMGQLWYLLPMALGLFGLLL